MAMDNVGVLVAFEHELECCPAKKSKSLVIVPVTVENPPIEEVLIRMRFDEEAFAAMNEAEINAAMNAVIVPGNPQIFERKPQIEDLVVAQAVVFRQDNLDVIPANFQFAAQPKHDVAQSAHFGNGSAFGSNHYDVHVSLSAAGKQD